VRPESQKAFVLWTDCDAPKQNKTGTREFHDRCLKPLGHPSNATLACAKDLDLASAPFRDRATGLKAKLDVEPNIYHTQTVLISGNGSARNLR
jgi:hypothetical protein